MENQNEENTDTTIQSRIFGGATVSISDPVAKSSVGFFTRTEYYGYDKYIDISGSGTMIAPNIAVGAAHTCRQFSPQYAVFGPNTKYDDNTNIVSIDRCVVHPLYGSTQIDDDADYATTKSYDIALFYLNSTPSWVNIAKVASPGSGIPNDITIAGFGSYDGQFDMVFDEELNEWISFRPYSLRKANSFISEIWTDSWHFMDGPNPGISSCQGDSGGSIYAQTNMTDTPILLGMPLAGPGCPEGIGYDQDIRYYVDWIESTTNFTLEKHVFNNNCGNGKIDSGETCEKSEIKECTLLNSKYISGNATCNNFCTGWDESSCVEPNSENQCIEEPCSNDLITAIPDNNSTGISSSIEVKDFNGTIDSININVNISHTYKGNLKVILTSPKGSALTLHNKSGGSGDNVIISKSYTNFNGEDPTGIWTLKVSDHANADQGNLNYWSIQITTSEPALCDNGTIDEGEICETNDTLDCASEYPNTYAGGTANCNSECSGYNLSTCQLPICGNGELELDEFCDGNPALDCASEYPNTYAGGTANCNSDCSGYDLSTCQLPECGNGIIEIHEQCDDSGSTADLNCQYGLSSCTVCNSQCEETVGNTSFCGDNVINGSEKCDGSINCSNISGKSYTDGTASCIDSCTKYDETNCENNSSGDESDGWS